MATKDKEVRPSVKYETLTITPQMASDWLDKHANEMNRTLRQRKIEGYAADMKARKWDLNGETIIIADNEDILDGHHRLWACVMADVPFTTSVARGISHEKFKSIDTGAVRSPADVIYIAGTKKYQRQIATACTLLLRYTAGKIMHNKPLAPRDVSDYFDAHTDIETWIEAASKGEIRPLSPYIAAVTYAAAGKYRSKGIEFVEGLVSGANLAKGSPILALRNRLLSDDARLTKYEKFALVIQAWNAFIEARKLSRMQLYKGDTFPKIRGAHS